MPRLNRPLESAEAEALIQWRDTYVTQEPRLALLFCVPNGAAKPKRRTRDGKGWYSLEGQKMQRIGQLRGVSDYMLPVAVQHDIPGAPQPWKYHGLFLELKRIGGHKDVTPEEWWWLNAAASQGYATMVCAGWVEAAKYLCWYLKRPELGLQL